MGPGNAEETVPATGLEPATPCLQDRCATNCAKPAGGVQSSRAPGADDGAYGATVGVGVGVADFAFW